MFGPLRLQRLQPPGLCAVCRRWTAAALCPTCAPPETGTPRCPFCALRIPAGATCCGACLRAPPPFERSCCAGDYAFPWDNLIAAFKFRGQVELAAPLAARLSNAIADDARWPEIVLPIPLAPTRLAERGYNQAWELARRIATAIDRPATPRVLTRLLDGPAQAALDRPERARNLRGAFHVDAPATIEGRRVALVDDVLTTGATAAEASRTLLRAGASAVHLWVLARTP